MAIVYNPGVYWCEIIEQGITESKNGHPVVVLKVKPYAHEDETPVERSIERQCRKVLTEKTIEYAIEDFRSLGFDRHSFMEIDPRHPNAFQFVGIKAQFLCRHKEYEGKDYEEWSVWRAYEPVAIEPIDKMKLKRLDGLFGKMLKDAPIRTPAKPAPSQSSAATAQPAAAKPGAFTNVHGVEVDDDDLPF